MAHKHMDAFNKDIDRLLKELEEIKKVLDKKPTDPTALAKRAKLAPFLTKAALEKRIELAKKLDSADTGKIVKNCGLPGW